MTATLEELGGNNELLQTARYGEHTEMVALLEAGADVEHADPYGGSTALHYASANGHLSCVGSLLDAGATFRSNNSGNTPLHWAAQNKHREVFELLCTDDRIKGNVDVLAKNADGKSALTCAFATGDVEMAKIALAHDSAAELEESRQQNAASKQNADGSVSFSVGAAADGAVASDGNQASADPKGSVVHEIQFTAKAAKKGKKGSRTKRGPLLKLRELPISDMKKAFDAKDVFHQKAVDDKTGLGLWPAAAVLSRWIVERRAEFKGQTVVELGAGCGLPGITLARYSKAQRVVLTDRHDATVDNLRHNVALNCNKADKDDGGKTRGARTEVVSADWADVSPLLGAQERQAVRASDHQTTSDGIANKTLANELPADESPVFDAVVGADLVYAPEALPTFLAAIRRLLKVGGTFLYVSQENRAGLVALLERCSEAGLHLVDAREAPARFRKNPLKGRTDLECELLLAGLLPDTGTTADGQTGIKGAHGASTGEQRVSFRLIEFKRVRA
jgi:predicted nicotinamide N-methyase